MGWTGRLVVMLNIFALVFCAFLCIKGLYAPSTPDSGSSGNWVIDFYWGTELYPRILGWDVKTFTNCRFGMMFWSLANISFAYQNAKIHKGSANWDILICAFLQVRVCVCLVMPSCLFMYICFLIMIDRLNGWMDGWIGATGVLPGQVLLVGAWLLE